MSKHTPGPWRIGTHGDRLAIYADGIYVAVVYSPPDDVAFIPEATANASLIAAAPEMYDALRDILLLEEHGAKVDIRALMDRVRALAARVEGRDNA